MQQFICAEPAASLDKDRQIEQLLEPGISFKDRTLATSGWLDEEEYEDEDEEQRLQTFATDESNKCVSDACLPDSQLESSVSDFSSSRKSTFDVGQQQSKQAAFSSAIYNESTLCSSRVVASEQRCQRLVLNPTSSESTIEDKTFSPLKSDSATAIATNDVHSPLRSDAVTVENIFGPFATEGDDEEEKESDETNTRACNDALDFDFFNLGSLLTEEIKRMNSASACLPTASATDDSTRSWDLVISGKQDDTVSLCVPLSQDDLSRELSLQPHTGALPVHSLNNKNSALSLNAMGYRGDISSVVASMKRLNCTLQSTALNNTNNFYKSHTAGNVKDKLVSSDSNAHALQRTADNESSSTAKMETQMVSISPPVKRQRVLSSDDKISWGSRELQTQSYCERKKRRNPEAKVNKQKGFTENRNRDTNRRRTGDALDCAFESEGCSESEANPSEIEVKEKSDAFSLSLELRSRRTRDGDGIETSGKDDSSDSDASDSDIELVQEYVNGELIYPGSLNLTMADSVDRVSRSTSPDDDSIEHLKESREGGGGNMATLRQKHARSHQKLGLPLTPESDISSSSGDQDDYSVCGVADGSGDKQKEEEELGGGGGELRDQLAAAGKDQALSVCCNRTFNVEVDELHAAPVVTTQQEKKAPVCSSEPAIRIKPIMTLKAVRRAMQERMNQVRNRAEALAEQAFQEHIAKKFITVAD
ncbi:uncharacterized protein LODBEIA_P44280 [Lodderomyces beijingensis]|uniref:Uncharacterized protein n=1 Tax=Lodderomyces beijingensis TaxID=1775926 RepID=A0ABP0ZQK1_9ASCO